MGEMGANAVRDDLWADTPVVISSSSVAMTAPPSAAYNWHPLVHKYYQESLYFYLVRLVNTRSPSISEQAATLLRTAGVRNVCQYAVYGPSDILIRAWVNAKIHRKVLEILERERLEGTVSAFTHFEATHLAYLWHDPERDLLSADPDIQRLIRASDELVRRTALHSEEIELAPGTEEELLPLVIRRPDHRPGQVKFYIALSSSGRDFGADADLWPRVLDAVRRAGLSDRASLYGGYGPYASFMVRAVADDYHDVDQWAQRLDDALSTLPLRPETLLLADLDSIESDNINHFGVLSVPTERSSDFLGYESDAALAELSESQLVDVNRLTAEAISMSRNDDELGARLARVIRACVDGDDIQLRRELSFLLDVEWLLASYMKRLWAECSGPDWIKVFAAGLQTMGMDEEAGLIAQPKTWTLNDVIRLARASADVSQEVNVRLAAVLGNEWKQDLTRLRDLRNNFAHGRMSPESGIDNLSGAWGQQVREAMAAATLHRRLENAARRRAIKR